MGSEPAQAADGIRTEIAEPEDGPRIVRWFEPTRYCVECKSIDLALVYYGDGHFRKECSKCGSCGPFAPVGRAAA